tara:strand:- start:27895 stop:28212 length:318 start_codon:yes stop_codon:yes gene_type:complete
MVPMASFALNALSPSCNAVGFSSFFRGQIARKGRSLNTGHNAANQSVIYFFDEPVFGFSQFGSTCSVEDITQSVCQSVGEGVMPEVHRACGAEETHLWNRYKCNQ